VLQSARLEIDDIYRFRGIGDFQDVALPVTRSHKEILVAFAVKKTLFATPSEMLLQGSTRIVDLPPL